MAVEALVRLSAMTLARQLSLGMCLEKTQHLRKLATRWRSQIGVEAVMSPLTDWFFQMKNMLSAGLDKLSLAN